MSSPPAKRQRKGEPEFIDLTAEEPPPARATYIDVDAVAPSSLLLSHHSILCLLLLLWWLPRLLLTAGRQMVTVAAGWETETTITGEHAP
eukprot:gene3968-5626_t